MVNHCSCKLILFSTALLTASGAQSQIDDQFDGAGNETYTGVNGFGAFNWVNAINFGFASQQGENAFLSNLTGNPIPDIGMIKPFSALMENMTYRVSFYCSRYSSAFTLGIGDYDTLYIGSRYGTMVWDTVPTPQTDFEWVRWTGLYTPAPQDIGQPFRFGFSLTLNNQTSFALDGPVVATEVATGIEHRLDAPRELTVLADATGFIVQANAPIAEMQLFDAKGAYVPVEAQVHKDRWYISRAGLSSTLYVVRVRLTGGKLLSERVLLK